MPGPAESVVNAFDTLVLESAQDARALQRRAQERADQLHSSALANMQQIQHQAALLFLQQAARSSGVEASYAGNHLRRASEVDAQESTAEGAVYKGESLASMPQTQMQHGSLYHDQLIKSVTDAVVSQVLTKLAQSTPPQTAGHAAEAPTGLK